MELNSTILIKWVMLLLVHALIVSILLQLTVVLEQYHSVRSISIQLCPLRSDINSPTAISSTTQMEPWLVSVLAVGLLPSGLITYNQSAQQIQCTMVSYAAALCKSEDSPCGTTHLLFSTSWRSRLHNGMIVSWAQTQLHTLHPSLTHSTLLFLSNPNKTQWMVGLFPM